MSKVNIDLIGKNGLFGGEVAEKLFNQSSLNPDRMRPFVNEADGRPYFSVFVGNDPNNPDHYLVEPATNATLRRDEWKALDDVVQKIAETRLGGIQDLITKGLVYNLGNAMGTTVLEWHDVSDALEAELTMDGVTRGKNDRVLFKHGYLPIPITHVDYEINMRVLEASRKLGNPLDTTQAERATRKVNEKLEEMLFTNTSYSFGAKDSNSRNSIYSYINFPDRNQVTLNTAWDDSAKTAGDILADVRRLKQASIDAKHYGPWILYIPVGYEVIMDEDYSTSGTSTQTIRDRILKIGGITDVKVNDKLPADNVLLVQMTSDVVRLVNGMPLQTVQWDTEGKFVNKYKVLTIRVPQIRSDYNGACGVNHLA